MSRLPGLMKCGYALHRGAHDALALMGYAQGCAASDDVAGFIQFVPIMFTGPAGNRRLLGVMAPTAALTPDLVANGSGTATINSQMLYRTAYIGIDLNVTAYADGEFAVRP